MKKFILPIFLLIIVLFISSPIQGGRGMVSSLLKPQTPEVKPVTPLGKVVELALKDTTGTYAIVIKNFKTNEEYKLNEERLFEPGSLYKLWLMGATYQQIKDKQLDEDELLESSIPSLNQKFGIPSEEAELKDGYISMTVTEALNQMIIISHNYAALLLTEKIGISKMAQFISDQNFNKSTVGDSLQTTASDIAKYYQKLYKGELIDREYSEKMLTILKKQQLNDGLPKYLPDSASIAHKTGDLGFFKHDAGIIFSPNGDYLIVILSESNSPLGAQERIAEISQAVYKYFNH